MTRVLRKGTRRDWHRYAVRQANGRTMWTGATTTNHNTVDCEKYVYGEFELLTDVRSNIVKPEPLIQTKLVHRQAIFFGFGVELDRRYEVFAVNGDRLDITLSNLGIRDTETREEFGCHAFFAANDNEAVARKRFA